MQHQSPQHTIHETLSNGGQIFFTSDIHGYHKNLCSGSTSWNDKSGCRNFENEILMTDAVVQNMNSVVTPKDMIITLGDFTFGGKNNIPTLLNRINCKNILTLRGNHDSNIDDYKDMFIGIYQYLEVTINKQHYILFHYPIASWNHMSSGSVHLYGHCHGSFENGGKSMDVGLDTNGLMPYNVTKIEEIMRSREIVAKDHHRVETTNR